MSTSRRQTQSGRQFEATCRTMASRRGCAVQANPAIGQTPWGTTHRPDAVLAFAAGSSGRRRTGRKEILVECKTQHVSGSTELKIFAEFEKLRYALEQQPTRFAAAWLVVGGKGWTPEMVSYVQRFNSRRIAGPMGPRVQVLTLDDYREKLDAMTR